MQLATLVFCALALAFGGAAHTRKYPDRPINLVTPYPAGSDIAARLVADTLDRLDGWSVVVENRGGAAGSIGTGVLANANPDGYTLPRTSIKAE
jgi:tripartite-type tricarboxylate transporter receptor subunit TctC